MSAMREPLRLVYLVPFFPKLSETFVLNELRELVRAGDDVTIVARRASDPSEPRHAGVEELAAGVVRCPEGAERTRRLAVASLGALLMGGVRAWSALVLSLRFAVASRRLPASLRAFGEASAVRRRVPATTQLVHAHFADTATTGALLARMLGCPCSFTGHAADLYVAAPPALLRAEIREARLAVATSVLGAEWMRGVALPGDAAKVVVIPNGIDRGRFRARAGEPSGAPLLLSIARLVPKKGIDTLLEALGVLAARGVAVDCELVGDGALRRDLEDLARRLSLDGSVRFLGSLDEHGVAAALERATALVLPCRVDAAGDRDGVPNVILEAMAVGVPVIAGAAGGVGEAVEDGRSGLLVPPDSPEPLADAIERLLGDPDLRARLVAGGFERTADLDVGSSVAQLRERLAEVAAPSPLSARRRGR